MLQTTGWVAVRKTDDKEWLDANTVFSYANECHQQARDDEALMSTAWVKKNPVVRYARCTVTEIVATETIETIGVIGRDA